MRLATLIPAHLRMRPTMCRSGIMRSSRRCKSAPSIIDDNVTEHIELLPDPLPAEPLAVVSRWMDQAWAARCQPNANSMVLATTTRDGRPSARVVLCKDIVPQPGYVVFYTNYLSSKGRQLKENPRAAAVIHWDALHRQVRIEGLVVTGPAADSDGYFAARSWDKRVGAWASAQSEPVASRAALERAVAAAAQRFGVPVPGSGRRR